MTRIPSSSQRLAIEAAPGPVLVLAGPGAGKTFCLIERIRFLIETHGFDPARICAFTFTNKAAGEISSRLEEGLGQQAEGIWRGTIHSFCTQLLRAYPAEADLQPGFGIADEEYQTRALRRIGDFRKWPLSTLKRFTAHRFRSDSLTGDDIRIYQRYQSFLQSKNMLDFDMLILATASLLRSEDVAREVRAGWDALLVDEFQDLNRAQYSIVRSLAAGHRNVFAVGDDEQSIYAWAGADPRVFLSFVNDFGITTKAQLGENRRCPNEVVTLSRRLVNANTPLFADRTHGEADRSTPFPIKALSFDSESAELEWIIRDIRADREAHDVSWGEYALLYRTHDIGYNAESGFLSAGVPCRMAQGRALADDPVVAYLIAALRVISNPVDPVQQERFLQVVLPRPLFDGALARADERREPFLEFLRRWSRTLPKDHGDRKKITRGFYALENLAALAKNHSRLDGLIDELLAQRVGEYRSALEEYHDDVSDPAEHEEVRTVARRLREALDHGRTVWIPHMGGCEIAIKGILAGIGLNRVQLGGARPAESVSLDHSDFPSLGVALGTFKAVQLIRGESFTNHFLDFTAVDVETTDRDVARAELVEIAATRVRHGRIVDSYSSLVKPRVSISAGARATHKLSEEDVADAPFFEDVWRDFRAFCDRDILVAHNGYWFDFPILRRMASALGDTDFSTYDTLVLARELHSSGARLTDLCAYYGVPTGESHRALDDTKALALVFLRLGEAKVARSRKTALDNLLDYVGLALVLSDPDRLCPEAARFLEWFGAYPFGRYSLSLDFYRSEREVCGSSTAPTMEQLIDILGGPKRMEAVRAEKTAEDRYPDAMSRLSPLVNLFREKPLGAQVEGLLERVALSRMDGVEVDSARVNLLTLHSTKGLEFSRVYIVGAEDATFQIDRNPAKSEIEEARRLMYVGITRSKDRLVFTRVKERGLKPTGGYRFLDEMQIALDPVP